MTVLDDDGIVILCVPVHFHAAGVSLVVGDEFRARYVSSGFVLDRVDLLNGVRCGPVPVIGPVSPRVPQMDYGIVSSDPAIEKA